MCPSCLYGFLLRSPAREWDIRAVLPHGFFYWVLIGLVAGWLAGKIARGRGFGCIADVVLGDRKSTRLNSSHGYISYAVFCLKKKNTTSPPSYHRLSICV